MLRGVKWIAAVALGVLGLAAGTAVGAGGSSRQARATPASFTGGQLKQLDPVLNDGSRAVLKALDQGLALVLAGKDGKGGTSGFKTQESDWNRVKNSYTKGESQFASTATKASDEFLNGVFSGGNLSDDLIQLLRLISGYQQKVSNAAANWDQTQNKTSYDLQVASKASASGTGAAAGKLTVSGLKGATQLTQTVAEAEVALYEKVAIAEIEYEGGLLDAKEAVAQIDAALAAFEKAITGGAKTIVKGAPVGWNTVVNKQVTPTTTSWNQTVNTKTYDLLSTTPQLTTTTTVTATTGTTSTVTQSETSPTVSISPCPDAGAGNDYEWPSGVGMPVAGSVSPAAAGATVTINYDSSEPDSNVTHTVTTDQNGDFSDSFTTPTEQQSVSVQATYGSSNSNACAEEMAGG
jgi:hypothetical protein